MVNSINTNIAAYFAQSNIGLAANSSSTSVARLSSGNRIIKASDDVAGLAIGTSLRTNVATLKVARLNSSLGTSLLQVADGALAQIGEILQRQKAIAVQASSGSLSPTQRGFLDQEFQQLVGEIDRIAGGTNFNGVNLLDGSLSTALQAITGHFLTDDPAANTNYVAVLDSETNVDIIGDLVAGDLGVVDPGNGDITAPSVINAISFGAANLNPQVIGNIENFTATYVSGDGDGTSTGLYVNMSFEVNGVVFEANGVDLTHGTAAFDDGTAPAGNSGAVAFTEVKAGGSGMTINITINDLDQGVIDDDTKLQTYLMDFVTDALEATYITQGRKMEADEAVTSVGGALEGIATGAVTFTTFSLDTAATDDVDTSYDESHTYGQVTAASVDKIGSTAYANGHISVTIGGKVFEMFNVTSIATSGVIGTADTLTLNHIDGETGRTETIAIALAGIEDIDVSTDEGAEALGTALLSVLSGVAEEEAPSGEAISFQVGVISSDALSVSLDSAQTADLYDGATLNVLTADAATTAADAIDIALDAVTTIRATVGALQSRFNFASANIDSTIQNQDAARGELLDTDIASEATSYATSQVKLQAGISVLAQANQQLQSLLKLIG